MKARLSGKTTSVASNGQASLNSIRRVGLLTFIAIAVLAGCGGSTKPGPAANASPTITFAASRALDGSDALGPQNIWQVKADGSGTAPLTRLNTALPFDAFTRAPVWSPDGAKLAFESSRALDGSNAANTNDIQNIWLINADGSNARPVTRNTALGVGSSGVVWSPDGAKFAYSSLRALDGSDGPDLNNIFNIWVANADGSGSSPLTQMTALKTDSIVLGWSVDGKKLFFESSRALDGSDAPNTNNIPNIWAVSTDGTGASPLTRLTASNALTFGFSQSPDGAKLAFMSARALDGSNAVNPSGAFNIWTINADGTGAVPLTRLTAVSGNTFQLAWSPDGTRIAFPSTRALDGSDASNANGVYNLWIVNSDGSGVTPLTRLTTKQANSFEPSWSADGKRLVFVSARALDGSDAANMNGTSNVWIVNADGSNLLSLTRVTTLLAGSDAPRWKP